MSSASVQVRGSAGGRTCAAARFEQLSRRVSRRVPDRLRGTLRRPLTRLYLATSATWLAFGSGLVSLADQLRFSATTGELVLVPVVVTALLHLTVRRRPELWNGRLGHGDWIGAGAGVAVALGILWWHPSVQLNDGAVKRLDLLALPLVLAAGLVLMLGLRVLVAGMFPLLFAFLAWPYPWTVVQGGTVADLAALTYRVSGGLVAATGAGGPLPDAGDNVLRIGRGAAGFEISVAPACSGFTGLVATAIMCGAALCVLRGQVARKLAWLVAGLTVTWLVTLLRIVLLALAGAAAGSGFALGVLHPVAGLLLDSAVFVGMLSTARRFGLRFTAGTAGRPTAGPEYPPPRARAVLTRLGVLAGLSGLFAALNLIGVVGPETGAQAARVVAPVDLDVLRRQDPDAAFVGEQAWSREFFGRASAWNRYRLRGRFDRRPGSVWVDSIVVDDPTSLQVHSVLECYVFHHSQVVLNRDVHLAGGLNATVTVVRRAEGDIWYSLHWQHPVEGGDGVRYERVVLMTAQPARTGAFAVAGEDPRRAGPVTVDPRVVAGLSGTATRLLGSVRG